ncbi:hypothetical protein D3C84_906880 [compost metagenome]
MDEEVFATGITQPAHHLQCLPLGLFAAKLAGLLLEIQVFEDAPGILHGIASLLDLGAVEVAVIALQHQYGQRQQH